MTTLSALEAGVQASKLLLPDYVLISLPHDGNILRLADTLRKDSLVDSVEPNHYRYTNYTPNDPIYSLQWHFPQIQMPQAWNLSNGNGVVVAVVDSGVAYENYDNYARAPDFANTTFVPGWDFVNNDSHPNDDHRHGTHVAGTIAQSTNNGIGVAGVAFGARIMAIKVLDASGSGTAANVANGIIWAADHGAKVINLSLGSSQGSFYEEEAVNYAYSRGVVVVAAAGNESANSIGYPAAYDSVISVGATRVDQTRAHYSNYGSALDLVAPGGDCSVDQNGDGYRDGVLQQTFEPGNPTNFVYAFYCGTSMAAPHVSGVAALLVAQGYATTPDQVRLALKSTTKDLGSTGWDKYYGCGLVQAYDALQRASSTTMALPNPPQNGTSASSSQKLATTKVPGPLSAFTLFLPVVSRDYSSRMDCGNRPMPTPTPTRTPTPAPTPTTSPAFSWSDDFSNLSSGWNVGDIGTASWSYQSGEYEMLLRNPSWAIEALAPTPGLTNYDFSADMRRYSGINSAYGLMFNALSDNYF